MEFQDKSLTCSDCAQEFIFSAGEQEFFERKGFKEIPKRCKPCREARKNRRDGGGGNGGNGMRTNGYRGDTPTRGSRGPRELHDAICARCGLATRVPFRPVTSRPVFCRDCYAAERGGSGQ